MRTHQRNELTCNSPGNARPPSSQLDACVHMGRSLAPKSKYGASELSPHREREREVGEWREGGEREREWGGGGEKEREGGTKRPGERTCKI